MTYYQSLLPDGTYCPSVTPFSDSRDFWKGGEIKQEEGGEDPVNQLSDRNVDQMLGIKGQGCPLTC